MTACISPRLATDPVVETTTGKVRGRLSKGAGVFLGIPYAKAARFQRPEPADPWAGTRECTDFGPNAPQSNPAPAAGPSSIILSQLPRPQGAAPAPRPTKSEDCQVLNIWTAETARGANRPVMVWLHGGFFSGSSGSTVDGTALATRHGAVVVSLNHRLNAFGFTDLSPFGDEFADSANAGMLDIIAALKWINANISAFGGDPGRVMVFGTSGGGMKTSIAMASPLARGLIHRAGVQSGPGLRFLTPDEASVATQRLLFETGLTHATVGDLRTLPMTQLLAAYHRVAAAMPPAAFTDIPCFGPVLDGKVMPRQPFSPDAAALTGGIPLIIGSNADEMTFFMGNDEQGFLLDQAGFEARVRGMSNSGGADDRIAAYNEALPDASPAQRWIRFHSDYSISAPIYRQAQRHAAVSNGQTWLYRLDLKATALGGKLGSTHTLETPLIFGDATRSPLLAGAEPAARLSQVMSKAWAGFAADGRPDMDDWANFGETGGAMVFDEQSGVFDEQSGFLADFAKQRFPHLSDI